MIDLLTNRFAIAGALLVLFLVVLLATRLAAAKARRRRSLVRGSAATPTHFRMLDSVPATTPPATSTAPSPLGTAPSESQTKADEATGYIWE